MAGNNVSRDEWGNIPKEQRTHIDTGYKIFNGKVLLFKGDYEQAKNILKSNTPNTKYFIAILNDDGNLQVVNVNFFKGYNIDYEINIVSDRDLNIIPFERHGSHSHYWKQDPIDGKMKRGRHDNTNLFEIDSKYDSLVKAIELFNKSKNKFYGATD